MIPLRSPICAACAEVAITPGITQPHRYMHSQGKRPTTNIEGGQDLQYRCLECDTIWLLHLDKWGANCGFKLLP